MSKFYGEIGYAVTKETAPGVYTETVEKRNYCGDLLRNSRSMQSSGQVNENINISNEISIVADPFAMENFHSMLYVNYMGANWKVSNVEVRYPRLILTIGGVYNGQTD